MSKLRAQSIKFKVMAPIILSLFVIVTGYTFYWSSAYTREMRENFESQIDLAYRSISPVLVSAIWQFDDTSAQRALEGLDNLKSFVFAKVLAEGDVFAARVRSGEWEDHWEEMALGLEVDEDGAARTTSGDLDVLKFHLRDDDGNGVGYLVVGFTSAHITAAIWSMYTQSAVIAGIMFVGIAFLMNWIANSVTVPLTRVSAMIGRITEGDHDFEVTDSDRRDEIGSIAKALEVFRSTASEVVELQKREEEARAEADKARARMLAELEAAVGNVVNKARQGDFSVRVEARLGDRTLDSLADNVNGLLDSLDISTKELSDMLCALSKGDLTGRIDFAFQGRLGDLKTYANDMAEQLTMMVAQIRDSSSLVNRASSEIDSGTMTLSHRTEQAAANLQETSAAATEVALIVKENASSANEAAVLAETADRAAGEGRDIVQQAIEAMSEIKQSSDRVTSIIGMIDEIAFQTNLLALNASVEAARAGEAGKGFAVVAQEVRQLSQRSAEAASNIRALVQESNQRVTDGASLFDQTGNMLSEIVGSIGAVVTTVQKIAGASQKQAASAQEISSAIGHLDEMTQQNAALVEETAASTQSLSSEAAKLNEQTAAFKLVDSQAPGSAAQQRLTGSQAALAG